MKRILPVLVCLFSFYMMWSQNPADYKWENRAVVVFTDSANSEKFEAQRKELIADMKGFEERKLVLLHSTPGKFRRSLPVDSEWIENMEIHNEMLDKDSDFEVILIGLDGSVKLRQRELLEARYLFNLIDSMPIRQAEIKRNNY
ncbi:DUF4174 domain-containing protein [Gramella jeungdoensis]|uniref:DUF4174 domain-containing protein n=1 Tax=Gramella jeungdoensis TaxID=708091 RepID=A0ABT0Z249_9FLAO|nr:DUF4174 domain-containing protein [Gramella jeungdoensis]MCM8569455.1 DUF4174 domain-containing protein [Gramella jeungdoensis]